MIGVQEKTWEGAFERLEHLKTLKKDWDSYGADPLSPDVIARVREVLEMLKAANWEVPYVIPCVNGETIQLEWHSNGRDEEWEIYYERVDNS